MSRRRKQYEEWCGIVAAILIAVLFLMILISWLISSAMPNTHVRSLLNSDGIRWFLGHLIDHICSPVLVWIILLTISYGTLKSFVVPKDMIARSVPILEMINELKAFHSTSLMNVDLEDIYYKKTVDDNSVAGTVFLVHKDKVEVDNNLNFLRSIESNAFSLILSDEGSNIKLKDDETYLKEIDPIIKRANDYNTCLFITDQFVNDSNILQIDINHINDLKGTFDFIILNLNKSLFDKSETEKVNIFLKILLKLKTGGIIFISKNSYQFLPSGRKGVEALIKLLDYNIELPPYDIFDNIIASKKH